MLAATAIAIKRSVAIIGEIPFRVWNFISLSGPPNYDGERECTAVRGYQSNQVRGSSSLCGRGQGGLSVLSGAARRWKGRSRTQTCSSRQGRSGSACSSAGLAEVAIKVDLAQCDRCASNIAQNEHWGCSG